MWVGMVTHLPQSVYCITNKVYFRQIKEDLIHLVNTIFSFSGDHYIIRKILQQGILSYF